MMRRPDAQGGGFGPAPVTLRSQPFPEKLFNRVVRLQPQFNLLVHAVSQDTAFLREHLANAALADADFTGRLLAIQEDVASGALETRQKVVLGIHRSDYFANMDPATGQVTGCKQIELNTIASAFGCLSSRVTRMHQYLGSTGMKLKLAVGEDAPGDGDIRMANPVISNAEQCYANAIAQAFKAYTAQRPAAPAVGGDCGVVGGGSGDEQQEEVKEEVDPVVMIVVQPGEANSGDQDIIRFNLWDRFGIRAVRHSLDDVHRTGSTRAADGALIVAGREVAVAYFRAGYAPEDYR